MRRAVPLPAASLTTAAASQLPRSRVAGSRAVSSRAEASNRVALQAALLLAAAAGSPMAQAQVDISGVYLAGRAETPCGRSTNFARSEACPINEPGAGPARGRHGRDRSRPRLHRRRPEPALHPPAPARGNHPDRRRDRLPPRVLRRAANHSHSTASRRGQTRPIPCTATPSDGGRAMSWSSKPAIWWRTSTQSRPAP